LLRKERGILARVQTLICHIRTYLATRTASIRMCRQW
jgi:hypothetical protein